MWSEQDIAEAVAWGALIVCSPFIFFLTRKLSSYMFNRFWPKDVLITYQDNGIVTEAYYIQRSFLKGCKYYKLSQDQLRDLGEPLHEK